MPRIFVILLTLLPALFASGDAVTAVREIGADDARTCLRQVSLPVREDYPYEASLDFRARAPIESTPGADVAGPFALLSDIVIPGQPGDPVVTTPYTADYAYDANGNMTQDRHSAITAIKYNVLNLPQSVTYEGFAINLPVSEMVYDAQGRKHIVRSGSKKLGKFTGDVTRYVGEYIVVNDTVDRLQTPYGYLRDGIFHSYVFDYQGNVMAVVAGGNAAIQTNLYYPDGLPMNTSTSPTTNRFKYSGKELSLYRGLPVYDFTARHTLPQLSNTFRVMDPCAESFYSISPYTFCAGDPVNYVDPSGKIIMAFDGDMGWEFRKVDGEYGFYNSDNKRYEGDNNFMYSLEESLNKINSCAIGNAVIDKLIETTETLTLESTIENNGTDNVTITKSDGTLLGKSSTILWNSSSTHGGVSRNSSGELTDERPTYIGLAHEMGHAYDHLILNGKWNSQIWYHCDYGTKDKSDLFAGTFENIIRFENNIAPRLYYGKNQSEGSFVNEPIVSKAMFIIMSNLF